LADSALGLENSIYEIPIESRTVTFSMPRQSPKP
jgi:hypothetical protein